MFEEGSEKKGKGRKLGRQIALQIEALKVSIKLEVPSS